MKYMQALLLRDLSPPWLDHKFPQALPGEGLLSSLTRPSFLFWPAQEVFKLFGAEVHGHFVGDAARVALEFAGVVARPLYKCTEVVDASNGGICMNVVSMSRFLKEKGGRPAYLSLIHI